ncbi:GerAB/ArcD/ProY family transporter [Bacillus sp. RD4P76]|uniref:GerAB/ArcD/ProY family transporter n=2 Tax=Bacillus suaedaesalsae TaxID=2810349 RepID=A0ABS2DF24_9BACI|nr:GerAB/ArcD/ProY family transporter [Bacillus suaedaesalsae]
MMVNLFVFVPTIMIEERFHGAVMAIPIGIIVGSILLFMFVRSSNKFSEKGIPEILELTPKWFRVIFLVFLAIMWFLAGSISLLAFNNVTIRFLNPDISGVNMILAFAVCTYLIISRLTTIQILYALEIIMIINFPLMLLLVLQAYMNDYISWASIVEVGGHFSEFPSYGVIAAATFIFSGYANMAIFNRVFKDKIPLRTLWLIPILGTITLFTTLFIPIGFWGADGVGDLNFPWVSTADTLRIEYGPIERLISIFLLLYISVSLMSVTVHWHVSFEVIKSMLPVKKFNDKRKKIIERVILLLFIIVTVLLEMNLREAGILEIGKYWLDLRLPSETVLVVIMFLLARRK